MQLQHPVTSSLHYICMILSSSHEFADVPSGCWRSVPLTAEHPEVPTTNNLQTCRNGPEDRRLFSPGYYKTDRHNVWKCWQNKPASLPRSFHAMADLSASVGFIRAVGVVWSVCWPAWAVLAGFLGLRLSAGQFPCRLEGERPIVVYISRKFTPLLLFYDSQRGLYIKHKRDTSSHSYSR